MNDIRPCAEKKHQDLAKEWDLLAEERHSQISSGQDLSFEHVLVPMMFRLCGDIDTTFVLDIGSGTGNFTLRLAQVADRVIGIDPSSTSISIARANCLKAGNVQFIQTSLEEAPGLIQGESVTAAVACMTLMTTPDLTAFVKALAVLLKKNAKFVATFSHPCFWPSYWGYERKAWFNYSKEIFIEAPFAITRCSTKVRTTHIHRPLEQYISTFTNEGFRLEEFVEPIPSQEIQALYSKAWEFPRFIGFRWIKTV